MLKAQVRVRSIKRIASTSRGTTQERGPERKLRVVTSQDVRDRLFVFQTDAKRNKETRKGILVRFSDVQPAQCVS